MDFMCKNTLFQFLWWKYSSDAKLIRSWNNVFWILINVWNPSSLFKFFVIIILSCSMHAKVLNIAVIYYLIVIIIHRPQKTWYQLLDSDLQWDPWKLIVGWHKTCLNSWKHGKCMFKMWMIICYIHGIFLCWKTRTINYISTSCFVIIPEV